jgi:Fe-S cluster assembly ATP-binding protein
MLEINDLHVAIGDKPILKGLSLHVPAGQVHAIMGRNGAGKSTLAKALLGHEAYAVTGGTVSLQGTDLLALEPDARCHAGVFVGYQYPVEVPGVNNAEFLRLAANAGRKARGETELDRAGFAPLLEQAMRAAEAPDAWRERDLNSGFSGGEKKRNEIVQMFVLQPRVAVLDETDSGLDVDALRAVARGINAYRRADRAIVLITHYQRLLDLVEPDMVHILHDGRIVKSGGKELATTLEQAGYEGVLAS